ncbi:4-hydroxy-2-oxo-heptane-1,7-dioate aldolase [Psilocybe cubensis]|uniref:HpcH/HpaI aldolase/citrate lyase domain-containing protein n=2 Tax=Psilocybe cubensis TaxID=181762 RepID=A0A8H7XQC1_PSICU|nr:4-hydroxy-2-oxo-heptane-1,7-dioate aldolase [Psilocybe cubensis]KAH9478055.1 4-hydroxy-2-oxo-heptane-1,7-dioate aldolase [Psilocybe cubensis]
MALHPLKQALRANKPAFGAWLTLPGTFHARTVAKSTNDLSWIAVDCEHGLIPLLPAAAESIAAIEGARPGGGPSAIVRIPATGVTNSSSWQIKHALDGGARGIIVPLVSTAAKAKEVVADSRFPPLGRRGFGSPFTHGTWGVTASEYINSANDEILVMIQIENKEAVENVSEIANVDGVDVLFIGPYDLSICLGYPTPNPDPHPDVEKVIQKILQAAHESGKKCAIYCTSGKQAALRAQQGFDMINVTSDMGAMSESIAHHIAVATTGTKQ